MISEISKETKIYGVDLGWPHSETINVYFSQIYNTYENKEI